MFEFYAPAKMKDNPIWISVTELMQLGTGKAIEQLLKVPDLAANVTTYLHTSHGYRLH